MTTDDPGQGEADPAGADGVLAVVRAYYRALEYGAPLAPFYATDEAAGDLGPVVKIGSGEDETFRGSAAVRAEVTRVGATYSRNRLESRGLQARRRGDVGWFSDQVWWSGEADGEAFASLTRWTGVCLRLPAEALDKGPAGGPDGAWRLLQLHVSEAA